MAEEGFFFKLRQFDDVIRHLHLDEDMAILKVY